jgi:hypothetical protein
MTMFKEYRVDPREALNLPLRLGDGTAAVTRDISASGMYIEIPGEYALKGPLHFELHLLDANMKFTAHGEIVRVENGPAVTGVAVKLISPRLEPLA